MANTAPTITIIGRVKRIAQGRGMKIVRGKIILCANSTHQTSAIEKYFRKCNHIETTLANAAGTQAIMPVWDQSTTNKNGILRTFGVSTTSAVHAADDLTGLAPFGLAMSGTFVAFGS